jgi:serine/threonine protein kinase
MYAAKTPDTEPIPGYRLLEPLGRGGYGEVWKCVAPGGLIKAIKFVAASDSISDVGCAATQELQALELIKAIRHPFLLSIERVEVVDGELIIVMELADRSLNDLLIDYRKTGKVGIPRTELIGYLHDAAEALDLLNLEHGLQHLDVKPRNLFLVGRHIKVADFGLVNSLAEMHGGSPHAAQLAAATPLYSSPESFLGRITLFSDQYSLAVSYCEMLTGTPPFSGRNFRQLALQHSGMEPDLSRLPEHDRAVVARSLEKEPGNRYPSCLEFVRALGAAAPVLPPHAPTPSRLKRALKPATKSMPKLEQMSMTPVIGTGAATVLPAGGGIAAEEEPQSLAKYQFLECLARLPIGEVWKARSPRGQNCLIKLVFGCQAAEDGNDAGAIGRLRALRHEGLEPFIVLRDGPNRVALICNERDGSLADRLITSRAAGQPGLPRNELLKHMRRTAETLDLLYRDHGLQHLTLNPRALLLDGGVLRIADFGLAELIWLPAGLEPGKLNPRYAPPELFEGRVVAASDQYSLALIYQELLTGFHAFRNLGPRQLASQRLRGRPNLDLLPAPQRDVIARAVDPEPEDRFPNLTAFVFALERADAVPVRPPVESTSVLRITTSTVVPASGPLPLVLTGADSEHVVKQLLGEAMGGAGVRELKGFRFRVIPNALMEHHFTARFLQGTLPIKLEGFRRHWLGKVIESSDNEVTYHITPPVKGMQRLLGRVPGLKLHVIHSSQAGATEAVAVAATLQPLPRGEHLLEELGPRIFDSIRQFLHAVPDRRREERFRLGKSLRILPVFDNHEVGEGIVAQALDISQAGLGFFLPCRPTSSEVLLEVGTGTESPLVVAATIIRSDKCEDGRYLIGAAFSSQGIVAASANAGRPPQIP